MLNGKNVVLGISASIAAYKSAFLCRELIKKGANVKVLMTPDSAQFVTPLTFSTLSKNPVYSTYSNAATGEWNNHVALAKWADLFLLAPATQNTIAKMANGVCDNLLLATYFSMRNQVYFAPAMDFDMFKHAANQVNIKKLQSYGNVLIPAEHGELASGLVGEGRMAEISNILKAIEQKDSFWANKKVMVTAGPTHEAIDPVRFIGNRSSGKMGYALANQLEQRGAEVYLISGPNHLSDPKVFQHIKVISADDMKEACLDLFSEMDVTIMAAAVADFTPKMFANQKIKKESTKKLSIELKSTNDILKKLGEIKKPHQRLIGFALETHNELENAKGKLKRKNLDMIVLNSLKNEGAGFENDTNQITILDTKNKQKDFELKSKDKVAEDILNYIQNEW